MIIGAFILDSISIKSVINRDAVAYMTEISIYINNGNAKYKSLNKKVLEGFRFHLDCGFCLRGIGRAGACAVASGQTEPLTDITRLHGAFQYARHFGTRGGNDSYQQTGGDACPRERDSGYLFYFRKRVGQYQRESG